MSRVRSMLLAVREHVRLLRAAFRGRVHHNAVVVPVLRQVSLRPQHDRVPRAAMSQTLARARPRRLKQTGLTRLSEIPPSRPGAGHFIVIDPDRPLAPQLPVSCPKCHVTVALERRGRELHCLGRLAGCGLTLYLVVKMT